MYTLRTPTGAPTKVLMTQSYQDIPSAVNENTINITTRYKRQKIDHSPNERIHHISNRNERNVRVLKI